MSNIPPSMGHRRGRPPFGHPSLQPSASRTSPRRTRLASEGSILPLMWPALSLKLSLSLLILPLLPLHPSSTATMRSAVASAASSAAPRTARDPASRRTAARGVRGKYRGGRIDGCGLGIMSDRPYRTPPAAAFSAAAAPSPPPPPSTSRDADADGAARAAILLPRPLAVTFVAVILRGRSRSGRRRGRGRGRRSSAAVPRGHSVPAVRVPRVPAGTAGGDIGGARREGRRRILVHGFR